MQPFSQPRLRNALIYKTDSTPVGRDALARQERRTERRNDVSFELYKRSSLTRQTLFFSPFFLLFLLPSVFSQNRRRFVDRRLQSRRDGDIIVDEAARARRRRFYPRFRANSVSAPVGRKRIRPTRATANVYARADLFSFSSRSKEKRR